MTGEDIRMQAVSQYLAGVAPDQICSRFHKSRRWLFKWVNRYRGGEKTWFKDHSRIPKICSNRTDSITERAVVEARAKLVASRYAQIGPLAVAYELQRQNIDPPPLRTIGRILRRYGLTRKRIKYEPKGKDYPAIQAAAPHDIHEMDIVGPRFLSCDGRFYSINIIDVFSGKVAVNPQRQRTFTSVAASLVETWQRLAIPKYLQMDNQLPFRGSNLHPRSFGLVIRLCLHLGIQPVFIPLSEPWRNGCVERFQDVFDKLFFRTQHFESFSSLVREAPLFEEFHNCNHRYSTRQGKTPNEREADSRKSPHHLAESFELPRKLYIEPGQIHALRFIRSDATLDIFGIKFKMPEKVIYEYVKATIDTGRNLLIVIHDNQVVHQQKFKVADTPIECPW